MWGGKRQVNVITVEFWFGGSSELFNYLPDNFGFGNSMKVYKPTIGQVITVEVGLPTLEKNIALSNAKKEMEMTFGLINGNNTQAQQWSISIEPTIESMLTKKRKEIIDIYS